jgi:hypothetical protein
MFPRRDRLLILFVALELVAFLFVPVGPLVIAATAMATSLSRSRPHMIALWILASLLTAIVIAPFVISLFHPEFAEIGPAHNA